MRKIGSKSLLLFLVTLIALLAVPSVLAQTNFTGVCQLDTAALSIFIGRSADYFTPTDGTKVVTISRAVSVLTKLTTGSTWKLFNGGCNGATGPGVFTIPLSGFTAAFTPGPLSLFCARNIADPSKLMEFTAVWGSPTPLRTVTFNVVGSAPFCEVCGNGVVEGAEQCDDGNVVSGDGCSSTCITEFCGDGTQQAGLGEECDDGNVMSGDGCSSTCITEFCGDGVVQAGLGENCDDGNLIVPANCGIGGCAASVTDACVNQGLPNECTSVACVPGIPSPESCDGIDNDCYGLQILTFIQIISCTA